MVRIDDSQSLVALNYKIKQFLIRTMSIARLKSVKVRQFQPPNKRMFAAPLKIPPRPDYHEHRPLLPTTSFTFHADVDNTTVCFQAKAISERQRQTLDS